jgi:hypothetical protein
MEEDGISTWNSGVSEEQGDSKHRMSEEHVSRGCRMSEMW